MSDCTGQKKREKKIFRISEGDDESEKERQKRDFE